MAGSFPTLAHGQTTQAGLVHKLEIRADIQQFRSGAEQRYALSGLLNAFTITLSDLAWWEITAVRNFWILQKGEFDSLWSITLADPLNGTERIYDNMAFNNDEFTVRETKPSRYGVTLEAVQTVGETVSVSPLTTYPTLATGAKWQLPSTALDRYKTDRNDLEAGKRFAYYAWLNPLRRWALEYTLINNAEVAAIVAFYLGQGGPVNEFSVVDADLSQTFDHCRFALGGLTLTRRSQDCNRLSLTVEQYKV